MNYPAPRNSRSHKTRILNSRTTFIALVAFVLLALVASSGLLGRHIGVRTALAAGGLSGAIYTSTATGTTVNGNIYMNACDVYLNGGPQNCSSGSGLPEGDYYFQVTNPSGSTLLSTDDISQRQVHINADGFVVSYSGVSASCMHELGAGHCSGAVSVQLMPFNPTPNAGGEYKVWVTPVGDYNLFAQRSTFGFVDSTSKTDNFKVKPTACNPDTDPDCHPPTAIGGVKYYDTNNNGKLDPGELGIEGVEIDVTLADTTVVKTFTDSTGTWALFFPEGTTYTACEVLPDGYNQTGPKDGATTADGDATANGFCWTGTVGLVDTADLNFGNIICKPEITCPKDATVECGDSTEPASTGTATGSSNCGDVTITHEDSAHVAACGNTYSFTRTWKATDKLSGNSTTCEQKITVKDTTPPSISTPPGPSSVECPGTPVFSTPTASDTCGSARVFEDSDVKTPGCGNTYSETKTWHAEDDCGNKSAPVSQTISVVDTTAPTIGNPGADATIFCPSTPTFTPPTASDTCGTAQVFQAGADVVTTSSCSTKTVKRSWYAKDACGNQSGTVSQTITVECNNCGGLTMGFWQNKNGQAIINPIGASKTLPAALTGWLRGFAPFQDLSATSTAAQDAAYVTNIIKAANASGAAMNAMLKAQMLATALDVYFSDGSLGGNQIGAPAPLGGVKIDLTHINKTIGSGSYENTQAAFGGINCQTVSQLLVFASSQATAPSGAFWYGQVKATQELAKDTFDAINNNVAFSCP